MKTIVHFGMPKTGSTSIQYSLYGHLTDDRFLYLDFGEANASDAMDILFSQNLAKINLLERRGVISSDIEMMRARKRDCLDQQMALAHGKTAILSAESIAWFNEQELSALYSALLARGAGPLIAIGYVRPPKAFIESTFQQEAKSARGVEWSWIRRGLPFYTKRYEVLDKVFSRENVQWVRFDPSLFPQGDVVLDFCVRIGMNFLPERSKWINEGLSLDAVRFLFAYRACGSWLPPKSQAGREIDLLKDRLADLKGVRFRFHSSIIRQILEERKEDIARMEARLGASLQEDLTKDDEGAVACVEDLFRFTSQSLDWLRKQIGPNYYGGLKTPEEVGVAMDLLRQKLVQEKLPLNKTTVG
ncbi:MAG: hypothetical protein HQL21_03285 [Candidatus Omnitrophica bacterium]|nr:hypothetical protein [Candidatus Omnitrophota bacterium]